MRKIPWKILILTTFLVNLIISYVMWLHMDVSCDCSNIQWKHSSYVRSTNKIHENEVHNLSMSDISNQVLFIIRDFEHFENDVQNTVESVLNTFPSSKIVILSDNNPYPPINFSYNHRHNVKIINLKPSLKKLPDSTNVFSYLDKDHIFILPDGVRISNATQMSEMLALHYKNPKSIVAGAVDDSNLQCLSLNISLRYWTMKYKNNANSNHCNALEGKHVLLVTKSLLHHLTFPFIAPLHTSLFIQATLLKVKTIIHRKVLFQSGKPLFTNPHLQWKHSNNENERLKTLYRDFGIKKIIFPPSRVEWHGCRKDTPRCFGTVLNNMPEYLFEGRWTPPCCIEHLRGTARYVFGIMQKCGVRYWLEGGSLLGAVRTGDIIPWDYDVDIGIYREDIPKCEWLKNSLEQSIVDAQGFVWEKAAEGDFIRVQYSRTNHLHVDIFPFYSRNGTMTKDTWFPDHPQDAEFPERFLDPLHSVRFVGVAVPAPNSYREFLELKFGKGVVENPEYPDPRLMKFSRKLST